VPENESKPNDRKKRMPNRVIDKVLRPIFETGIGPYMAHKQGIPTKIEFVEKGVTRIEENFKQPNYTTYIVRWQDWREKLAAENMVELVARQRGVMGQFIVSYDKIILTTQALAQQLLSRMKDGALSISEIRALNSVNDTLGDQLMAKALMEAAPLIDEKAESSIIRNLEEKLQALRDKMKLNDKN